MRWTYLDVPKEPERHNAAVRLNALGSLFYFSKFVLRRDRLSDTLHYKIAQSLEREHLHLVLEIPRDHLKTTLVTESLSMWWSLPYTETDEAMMRALGYDDAWIRWMKRAHNINNRTLIVSENEPNAIRFGRRIDSHYYSNSLFRSIFKEILPDASCSWNDRSKTQKRDASGIGEGTYDLLGVGGAVQSRHYDRIIQDDIFGRDAKNSELVANDVIEYHRLLAGVFDHEVAAKEMGDEVVVGNRWSYYDLNGWIRENDKKNKWQFETHDAEGGCCADHPAGTPIYFTPELLDEVRERFTVEDYSHQYRNLAVLPGEQPFKAEWLRYYELYEGNRNGIKAAFIRHNVYDGKTIGDLPVYLLTRKLIVDPNHSEEKGRSAHAIVVEGYDSESNNEYHLDEWAKSSSYDELVVNIYKLARRWRLDTIYLEKIAAQQLLRYPLEYRARIEHMNLKINYLTPSRSANFKDDLIRAMEPSFRNSKYWCRTDQRMFLDQYRTYPACRQKDVLNCMAYANQTFDNIRYRDVVNSVSTWNKQRKQALAESMRTE
jgi:hypothetical protein